uniref:Calmodulin n=1 Tax=Anisakis simplex TaxID=6269 RepID=A0A0M3K0H2_ANISI
LLFSVVRFESVDEDGDGKVTFNELEHWHKARANTINDQKLRQLFAENDKNRDSALSIAEFVQVAVELGRQPISQTELIFRKIDLNGDGIITLEESQRTGDPIMSRIMEGVFEIADIDHDGLITLKELATIIENENKPKSKEVKNKENAQRLLALIDANSDERLVVSEVHAFANINSKVSEQHVKEAFGHLDQNRDGFITLDELSQFPDKMAELVHFKEAPAVNDN